MSGEGDDKTLTKEEAAIIEMLKQQNISNQQDTGDNDGKKKHAFWDTQVRQRTHTPS